jgi:hypothetical protein
MPHRQARSITSVSSANPTPATLARRLLFPALRPTDDLPPLLISPNPSPELTAELYDFIALALRAFVNPWWTKITRYDKDFLPDITRVLTIVIRNLQARIVAADLSLLVFRRLPTLVMQHYSDYRNAVSKLSSSYATGGALSLPLLFHQLQPHMAVSADGTVQEEYYRQIIDHILRTCLPPEDYDPEPERLIIREIVLKVLLQDVFPKINQPWFIHIAMLEVLGPSDGLQQTKV